MTYNRKETVMIYSIFYLSFSLFNTDEHFIHIDSHMFTTYDIHGTHTLVWHYYKYYIPLNIYDIYLYDYTRLTIPLSKTHLRGGWCHHPQFLHHSIKKGGDHCQMLMVLWVVFSIVTRERVLTWWRHRSNTHTSQPVITHTARMPVLHLIRQNTLRFCDIAKGGVINEAY